MIEWIQMQASSHNVSGLWSLQSKYWDALPASMETVGGREEPLLGDDWGATVGRSNEVEADLPRPTPLLGIGAPDDAVEGGGTAAAAFRRGGVPWVKGRLGRKTKHSVKFWAGLEIN